MELIEELREVARWDESSAVINRATAAADRLEAILKAWDHYQKTMTQSGGEDWALEEAITGEPSQ
jgi:hypothetical protein